MRNDVGACGERVVPADGGGGLDGLLDDSRQLLLCRGAQDLPQSVAQLIPHDWGFEELPAGPGALLLVQVAVGFELLHCRYCLVHDGDLAHLMAPLRGLEELDNVVPCSSAGLLFGFKKGSLALLLLDQSALSAFLVR